MCIWFRRVWNYEEILWMQSQEHRRTKRRNHIACNCFCTFMQQKYDFVHTGQVKSCAKSWRQSMEFYRGSDRIRYACSWVSSFSTTLLVATWIEPHSFSCRSVFCRIRYFFRRQKNNLYPVNGTFAIDRAPMVRWMGNANSQGTYSQAHFQDLTLVTATISSECQDVAKTGLSVFWWWLYSEILLRLGGRWKN